MIRFVLLLVTIQQYEGSGKEQNLKERPSDSVKLNKSPEK